jgi:hypothetical protein
MAIKLTITYDPATSNISVEAPSDNVLAHGMLGVAQAYVDSRIGWGKKAEKKIIPFGGPLPPIQPQ